LARLAAPAAVEALLLSDVIGDELDVIGSGPTAPDVSTFGDAARILQEVRHRAQSAGEFGKSALTAESRDIPGDTQAGRGGVSPRCANRFVGSNRLALARQAQRRRS